MKPLNLPELILFEDDDFVVINKPPFLATLDERDTTRLSTLQLLQEQYPDIQLAHRLDKETSGVLAAAKHPEAYRHLSLQFQHRQVEKRYHAVVNGIWHFQQEKVTWPIAVSNRGNVRIDTIEGKPSETWFNTLKTFRQHTLLECLPVTGRMHQIRIHLASLQAPICADILYGGTFTYLSEIKRNFKLKKGTEELPLMGRVALHAQSLIFADLQGNRQSVEAPYPKDLRAFLRQLELNS